MRFTVYGASHGATARALWWRASDSSGWDSECSYRYISGVTKELVFELAFLREYFTRLLWGGAFQMDLSGGLHFRSALRVGTSGQPTNGILRMAGRSLQVSSLSSSVLNLHPEGCFYHFGGYLHSADFASPSNLRIVPETLFNWGISHEKTGLSTFGMVGASF